MQEPRVCGVAEYEPSDSFQGSWRVTPGKAGSVLSNPRPLDWFLLLLSPPWLRSQNQGCERVANRHDTSQISIPRCSVRFDKIQSFLYYFVLKVCEIGVHVDFVSLAVQHWLRLLGSLVQPTASACNIIWSCYCGWWVQIHIDFIFQLFGGLCEYWPIFYSATKENPIWGGNSTHLPMSLAPFHVGMGEVCFVWGQLDLSQTLWDSTVALNRVLMVLSLRWHSPGPNWYHHSWKFAAADFQPAWCSMENIPWTIYDICLLILFSCFSVYLLNILRICQRKNFFSHFKTRLEKE